MMTVTHHPGFTEPVLDAQRTFRAVLDAMARPTLPQTLGAVREGGVQPPEPLAGGTAAVLLALCDEDTPIWLDPALRSAAPVCGWLRFHTGAPLVDDARDALFAVASTPERAPRLSDLAQGTDEEPHRSATLVIDATHAEPNGSFTATGPGVNGEVIWSGAALPPNFLVQWQAERAKFPRGIDVIVTTGDQVRALPRTTALIPTDRKDAPCM